MALVEGKSTEVRRRRRIGVEGGFLTMREQVNIGDWHVTYLQMNNTVIRSIRTEIQRVDSSLRIVIDIIRFRNDLNIS